MTELIDSSYYLELSRHAPGDVCKRAGCSFDSDGKQYRCVVWDNEYIISPTQQEVVSSRKLSQELFDYFSLFVVHYLLRAKDIPIHDEWISEKDIPGGSAFFRGPHELPTSLICSRFENNIDDFKDQCQTAGGVQMDMADAAYSFNITPRIPVAVLYWVGDEDFPAESKLLFDRTIGEHLPLDIVYALAVGVCKTVGK